MLKKNSLSQAETPSGVCKIPQRFVATDLQLGGGREMLQKVYSHPSVSKGRGV